MALAINNNLMANNVTRNLQGHYGKLNSSTQRLSSGLRVSSAADDAAGLAIRELMRADIAALGQGVRNANDGISMLQTADGALGVIDSKLIRMKELAEQASTDTYTADQRKLINQEYQAMAKEITRIAEDTDFNGKKLLNGDGSKYTAETGDYAALDATSSKTVDSDGATTITLAEGADADFANAKEQKFVSVSKEGFVVESTFTGNVKDGGDATVIFKQVSADGTAGDAAFTDGSTKAKGSKIIIDREATTAVESNAVKTEANTDIANFYKKAIEENRLTMEQSTDGGNTWTKIAKPTVGSSGGASVRITVEGEGSKHVDTFIVSSKKADGATASDETFTLSNTGVLTTTKGTSKIDISTQNMTSTSVHFGSSSAATDNYKANIGRSTASALGVGEEVGDNVLTKFDAKQALDNISNAIKIKDATRADLGSTQNRLSATIENISIQKENLQAAESRISDVDVATEMTEFNKQQILANAAVSMLSQANNLPKMAQKLLG